MCLGKTKSRCRKGGGDQWKVRSKSWKAPWAQKVLYWSRKCTIILEKASPRSKNAVKTTKSRLIFQNAITILIKNTPDILERTLKPLTSNNSTSLYILKIKDWLITSLLQKHNHTHYSPNTIETFYSRSQILTFRLTIGGLPPLPPKHNKPAKPKFKPHIPTFRVFHLFAHLGQTPPLKKIPSQSRTWKSIYNQ